MAGPLEDDEKRARPGAVRWRDSLRTRIALWFGLIMLLLVLLVGSVTAWMVRNSIIEEMRRDARATAMEAAGRLDASLRTVAITTHGLADLAASTTLSGEGRLAALHAMVRATPDAAGALLALEPGADGEAFAHYVDLDGDGRDFVADGYDYRAQPWYRRTLDSDARWWSDPYENRTAGNEWMATYNVRVGDGGGMVSVDLPLARLVERVEPIAYLPGWRATLVSPGGIVAMSSSPDAPALKPLDQWLAAAGRDDLRPAAEAMRERRFASFEHLDTARGVRLYSMVEPVGDSGWSLLLSQSDALVVARLDRALQLLLGGVSVLVLLGMLMVRRLARQIGRPVEALAASAERMGLGDYTTPVGHTARADEVGQLARTLELARTSIQRQLHEIEDMATARQRLESELAIARDIQLALLPTGRVVGGDDGRLDAQGALEPAKAVGGDFYNFIERDRGMLWFVIGDVSDKGVPAALFMARALTILEVAVRGADAPEQVLAEASRRLVDGNDTCMFATVLCGRIDAATGDCALASAGHDPPLLLRADGTVEMLALDNGPPLGFEACERYEPTRLRLHPGDSLLAYTDGVTEAFNPDNEAYGNERLLAVVRAGDSAMDHCQRLLAAVHRFARGAPQSDDITVLAIRLDRDAVPQARLH